MASSISIPPRGSRSSSPRPPPHYKFTILAPDVYAPKAIKYDKSEDKSYGFCQFLMGKFESHFGMRCTMPTVAGAAFFGDFNEFEERFLVDAEYIVIVITSMSWKAFKKFYPRLFVFVTVRPEWVNRFIFVMVGDIMLEPSVDLSVFFHDPIFFKEFGWEADIETWKNLHVLLKVQWSPVKEKTGSPRCGDVVSIIQRTVVETEVQEVRTRRRTDSRRSEGGSTPGNLSPPRPARPVSTASTPSSPIPGRIGSHLSKSTDSHLHVVPPIKEKAQTAFNEAGEAVTSSAKPSEEKRRSPFLGRRSFGGRAKILVEQDLPKPKVKIEKAPEVQKEEEERRKRRNKSGDDQVFVDITSKLESCPERKKRASPERQKEKKKLLVGTENMDTEVCIVENIPIDGADSGRPEGEIERGEERKGKMDVDEKLTAAKRPAEKAEEDGKRRKTNERKEREKRAGSSVEKEERRSPSQEKERKDKGTSPEEKRNEKRASQEEKRNEKRASSEEKKQAGVGASSEENEERKAPTQEQQTGLAPNGKKSKWGEDMAEEPRMERSNPEEKTDKDEKANSVVKKSRADDKEDKRQARSKEIADREKLIAMETGESQTFVAMTSKAGISSKEAGGTSQWDYSLTSDYSSLNSSASSSRTLSSVQSPPPPIEPMVRSINIEDQGSAAPSQAVKKPEITERAEKLDTQQEDASAAGDRKKESSEVESKVTEQPDRRSSKEQIQSAVNLQQTDLAPSWRRVFRDSAQDPLHRPIPVFLLLATATALSPFYHSLSCAAFNSLMNLLSPVAAAIPSPSTVAILPAAAVAALPESAAPPAPPAPALGSSMMIFVSPLLLPFSSASNAIPQNLLLFRVSRGP